MNTRDVLREAFADFASFCALLEIIPKGGGRQRFALNDIQLDFNKRRTQRDIVLKPRQIGFTTLEQARDIFIFLTVPGARVVTTCQSMQDSTPMRLLAGNYRLMFDSLRRVGVDLQFTTENTAEWVLGRRDASLRIIQAGATLDAAQKKGRAGTITRLHLTETAFYEYAEETLNALFECVPGLEYGTEIVNESTPNGAQGLYFEQYQAATRGISGYLPHFYPWFHQKEYQTPVRPGEIIRPENDRELELVSQHRISSAQLKWYREKVALKGQALTDQEYPTDPNTCFLVSGRLFFEVDVVRRLITEAREPLVKERLQRTPLNIWSPAKPNTRYLVSVDPAEGGGGDPSAIIVYNRQNGEHVASLRGQLSTWELARAAAQLANRYGQALIVVERNNHGHAVLQALSREQKYRYIYTGRDGKAGWLTNVASRATALDAFEDAVRQGKWTSNDKELLAEMLRFVIGPTGKAQATTGAHDDMVMAAAIGWDVLSASASTGVRPGLVATAYRFAAGGRGY